MSSYRLRGFEVPTFFVGMVPLTGTTNPTHMAEDLRARNLTLEAADLVRIESIAS